MRDGLLIYGATGYSGRRLTRRACELGLRPIVAGRDPAKLEMLAAEHGLEHRVAAVSDSAAMQSTVAGMAVVLNAAGPFSRTARPIADACLEAGAHYLDITAEIPVIEALAGRHAEAARRGVMLMPAVGFDVVPSDCLAAYVARRLPSATRLSVAVTDLHLMTRGTAKTLLKFVDRGLVRRDGRIERVPLGSLEHCFDFGDGPRPVLNVSLADVATAYYSTGIPDITTYGGATPLVRAMLLSSQVFGPLMATAPMQAWADACLDLLPPLPVGAGRENVDDIEMVVAVEARDDNGRRARARLQTPEAYEFTGFTGTAIAHRVMHGDFEPGFQTPARIFGPDFVLSFPQVRREDLE